MLFVLCLFAYLQYYTWYNTCIKCLCGLPMLYIVKHININNCNLHIYNIHVFQLHFYSSFLSRTVLFMFILIIVNCIYILLSILLVMYYLAQCITLYLLCITPVYDVNVHSIGIVCTIVTALLRWVPRVSKLLIHSDLIICHTLSAYAVKHTFKTDYDPP